MLRKFVVFTTLPLILAAATLPVFAQKSRQEKQDEHAAEIKSLQPVFWRDPGDIRSKDLFNGPGGKENAPQGPFTYVEEDFGQTTPKFDLKDASGDVWRAKLGVESQSETVAARIMWALGFAANTNYFIPEMIVPGIKARQKRGTTLIEPDDKIYNVRLQRKTEGLKKLGMWDWRDQRFHDRRDFNGLRVMMAVLSNWDLKAENNAIFRDEDHAGQAYYGVTDVGATFGKNKKGFDGASSKNNIDAYEHHKLVSKVGDKYVDLNFPDAPSFLYFLQFEYTFYFGQWRNHWVGRHIPKEDVRWVAGLLSQLSEQQLRDAFRAANYRPEVADRFVKALQARIAELKKI